MENPIWFLAAGVIVSLVAWLANSLKQRHHTKLMNAQALVVKSHQERLQVIEKDRVQFRAELKTAMLDASRQLNGRLNKMEPRIEQIFHLLQDMKSEKSRNV